MRRLIAIVVLSHCLCAAAGKDIRGFWRQVGGTQEILFYGSTRPDSGNFDERYQEKDSGKTVYQGCLGNWKYKNDSLYYQYTSEVVRDSATWALIPEPFDST